MKHILLIIDGDIALHFLNKLLSDYYSNNQYIVICKDSKFIPEEIPSTFSFFVCDYTSFFRLNRLIRGDISDAFIILQDNIEKEEVYKYLRTRFKNIRIITNIRNIGDFSADISLDSKLVLVNELNALSARLLARMPNVPIIPRGFGLEQGEVMEVGIPSGSIFAHRQIGTIRQNEWRIIGIYRNGEFKLANYQIVIWPGDTLLIAGDPVILKSIYNQIKSDIGQFPLPFGRDIHIYIDMNLQNKKSIFIYLKEAIFLHRRLKSVNLVIRILRPNNFEILKQICLIARDGIEVRIDYNNYDFEEAIKIDSGKKMGLIIVGREIFRNRKYRKALFNIQTPVYKIGKSTIIPKELDMTIKDLLDFKDFNKIKRDIFDIDESLIVVGSFENTSNISSVIFDISRQMGFDVCVYDFESDGQFDNSIDEEYHNLSRIFEVKVKIERNSSYNPILYLRNIDKPVLHFVPFEKCITKSRALVFLKTKFEDLSFMLNVNPQIFIPM